MVFDKILIANRGEIAIRIIRSAHDLGFRTVAVASEADAEAPHVRLADQAVIIGPAEVSRSYLNIDAILDAALRTEADAVHPGYGFLAENADFAEACVAAGLIFIGPPAEAIRLMGNKRLAKMKMADVGVPCIPGYGGAEQDNDTLASAAGEIGYPLMVKAAAGGGGRGMRLVDNADELDDALGSARSEAENAFGSGELILERAVSAARHVEIQVFADSHGHVVHLGERDCSIQRRHQKVIEEAPSPAVDAVLRQAMGEAAVTAARAIDYCGAGTVEFLLAEDGEFYFLEMNTRLQVEHPVTEMITGLDLVAWQLHVAAGGVLPLEQNEIPFSGHAIEARLYAEDPSKGFLPETGRILRWEPAMGAGIRIDAGIEERLDISPYYDPMLAKVIAHGATREEARRRLVGALKKSTLLGLRTNKNFLIAALNHDVYRAGCATTEFIAEQFPASQLLQAAPTSELLALAAALLYEHSAWGEDWRSATPARSTLHLRHGDAVTIVAVTPRPGRTYEVAKPGDEKDQSIKLLETNKGQVRFTLADIQERAAFVFDEEVLHLEFGNQQSIFMEEQPYLANKREPLGDGQLLAPMAGRIVAVRAKAGGQVARGDILVVLEAMKMEHEIRAEVDGTVTEVGVSEGDQVMPRQLLAAVEPNSDPLPEQGA